MCILPHIFSRMAEDCPHSSPSLNLWSLGWGRSPATETLWVTHTSFTHRRKILLSPKLNWLIKDNSLKSLPKTNEKFCQKKGRYIEELHILMMVLTVALLPRLDSQILLGVFIYCFFLYIKPLAIQHKSWLRSWPITSAPLFFCKSSCSSWCSTSLLL